MTSVDIKSKPSDSSRSKAGWVHFAAAVAFLLALTIGWNVVMDALGYIIRKEPVPWPAGVTVDPKTFQNTSLPDKLGPYKLVEEIEHKPDVLETLKIGTPLDSQRIKLRQSNWYLFRRYADTREDEHSPYRYWMLDVVFYTGGETTVPHVPDICIVAGGARSTGSDYIPMECPGSPAPWNKEFKFKGLYYERPDYAGRFEQVQYYLFDVNGRPEVSRERVRLALTNLRRRHVFYAKVQFYIPYPVTDRELADDKAREFLEYCLPSILKELPSQADVDRLQKQSQNRPNQ
jgi:hypothetical protein